MVLKILFYYVVVFGILTRTVPVHAFTSNIYGNINHRHETIMTAKQGSKPGPKKKRKKEYDISSYTIANQVPKIAKKKRDVKSRNEQKDNRYNSLNNNIPRLDVKRIDLRTQLDYARNGHAVLRNYLNSEQFQLDSIREQLMKYGKEQELIAWRQKVEVAADSNNQSIKSKEKAKQLANSCKNVQECKEQLQILLKQDVLMPLPFLQYFNTWRKFPQIYNIVQSLAETASILMNVQSVRLYQDSIFWKRTYDGITPWHTDARMAPFDTSHMITFWIPLNDIIQYTGLIFCSQTHNDFALPYWNNPTNQQQKNNNNESSVWDNLNERYQNNNIVDYMPLHLGDITVHSGWTLHCTGDNNDNSNNEAVEDRIALAITYVDANAPIRSDALSPIYGDREDIWSYEEWVKDIKPNTYYNWDHPLVPILWPTT